jgi:hypothetical protein
MRNNVHPKSQNGATWPPQPCAQFAYHSLFRSISLSPNRDIPLTLIGGSGRVSTEAWTYFSQKKHSCHHHHHLHTQLREMVVVIGLGLGLGPRISSKFFACQPTCKIKIQRLQTFQNPTPDSAPCMRKCLLLSAWRPLEAIDWLSIALEFSCLMVSSETFGHTTATGAKSLFNGARDLFCCLM